MAAAAATLELEPHRLQQAPMPTNVVLFPDTYISVDSFPLLAAARQEIRESSEAIVESHRLQIATDNASKVPEPIDALSMADQVLEARDLYGENSVEHQEKKEGLFLDYWRALAEWRRKLKPEYFDKVRHTYDPETGDYLSHGRSTDEMTINGLTPLAESEEVDRRINERVENATPGLLKKLGGLVLDDTVRVRTISQCADFAIRDYQNGVKSNYGGYVPQITKIAVRDFMFDTETEDRFEEQVALPGDYLRPEIIHKALMRRHLDVRHLDKTQLHGTQILATDDIIDFVELLDTVASEEWCVDIFMGEKLEPGQIKDYASIRETAQERQKDLREQAATLALFVTDLAEDPNTDRKKAPELVEEFAKHIMLNIADQDNALAYEIFDEETAEGLREVNSLREAGRTDEALTRFNEVVAEAPVGGYCTAGSCGLEAVKPGSDEEVIALKYGAKSAKDAIKDSERKCPNCKQTSVMYITNKKLKVCTNSECKVSAKGY